MNLHYLFNSLRTWRFYRYYLIAQLLILTSIITYEIANFGTQTDRWFISGLEFLVTLAFSIEVFFRAMLTWSAFWKSPENLFDLMFLLMIYSMFIGAIYFPTNLYGIECKMLPAFWIGGRYVTQLIRIGFDLASCSSIRKAAKMTFDLDDYYEKI